MKKRSAKQFVVIDGNSLLYRAFYALPPLQNRRGEHTNAVYGFTTMLMKLLQEENPDYIAVAFDPPKPSFRVRIDQSYKAQREKTPPELAEQARRVREILGAMHIPVFEVDDYEADDVIGTLADRAVEHSIAVTVVSGDADLLQLIGDDVTVVLTRKGISHLERYDRSLLEEKYGLSPEQIVDYKALKGDSSDNIPGVPGIGDKTARNLLQQYGNVDNLYENIDQIKEKTAEKLSAHREQLERGKELVTLRRDIDLTFDLEGCLFRDPDHHRLIEIFGELEFKSLVDRIKAAMGAAEVPEKRISAAKKLHSTEELTSLLGEEENIETLTLLTFLGEGRPYWRRPLKLLALAVDAGKIYYLDLEPFQDKVSSLFEAIFSVARRGAALIVHDVKLWHHLFAEQGLEAPRFAYDTLLASYLADPARGGYDVPGLLQRYLGLDTPPLSAREQKALDVDQRGAQLAEEAGHLFALREYLDEELAQQELSSLLIDLEMPLAGVLTRMERRGITIDSAYLDDLSVQICRRLEELEAQIYEQAGEEFNINSPQQLSRILFDKLQLPVMRKTKTGRSTDARVLEELALQHDIAGLLLLYRQLAKLEGTYLTGLVDLIDEEQQKLYTTFNQAATATGRLSSSDPNLQNIPIRLEEGRRMRRAFIPSTKEKIFFAADYSQVELRVLAHLSADPILVEAFNTGQDIHRRTAAEVNNVDLKEVTPLMRERAKAVNFGIIYGSSDYGLAQGLKISRAEAKAYIDSYFERYRGVKEYMESIVEQARETGYVTTILNRRRYLPEINAANHNTRSFAERMALNTPIQGSAADIIKLAMLTIDRIIEEGGFKATMLLQIHDELLFEIEEEELDFFAPMVRREMEEAFTLRVPLQVDLKWGRNWEELKTF